MNAPIEVMTMAIPIFLITDGVGGVVSLWSLDPGILFGCSKLNPPLSSSASWGRPCSLNSFTSIVFVLTTYALTTDPWFSLSWWWTSAGDAILEMLEVSIVKCSCVTCLWVVLFCRVAVCRFLWGFGFVAGSFLGERFVESRVVIQNRECAATCD